MINIKVNKKLVSIFLLFALVLVATAAVSATDSDQTTAVSDDSSLDTSSSDTVATSDSSASTASSSAATTDNSATSSSSSGDVKTTASSDTTTQKADTSSSANVKESSSSSQASTTTKAADTNTVSTKSVDTQTVSSDSSSKTLSTDDYEANNYYALSGEISTIKSNAQEGDSSTIELISDAYDASSTLDWTTEVEASLTINGNNAVITGDGSIPFFTVGAQNTLTLNDMTITGFSSAENGGAINTAGTLILNNVNFVDNTATNGGAIYNTGDSVTITDSTFDGNTATNYGGAIYNDDGTLTIEGNTVFTGNTATVYGGAIFSHNTGIVEINGATFGDISDEESGNTAAMGGAIWVGSSSELTVTDSTFSYNKASQRGGAIYTNGKVTIDGSTFTYNTATNDEESTEADGGAIYTNAGSTTISDSEFTDNEAKDNGGAIYNSGTMEISTSTFTDNEAETGTAIYTSHSITMDDQTTIVAHVVGQLDEGYVAVTSPIVDTSYTDDVVFTYDADDDDHKVDGEISSSGVVTANLPLDAGDHIVFVDYADTYANPTIELYVEVTNTVLTVNPIEEEYKINDTLTVSGTLMNGETTPLTGQNVTITLVNNGENVTVPVNATVNNDGNFVAEVTLTVEAGTYTVNVNYAGDEKQQPVDNVDETVTVDKLDTYIVISVSPEGNVALGSYVTVIVELFDENGVQIPYYDGQTLTLTLNGAEQEELHDIAGVSVASFEAMQNGLNTLVASYDGLENFYNEAESVEATYYVEGIAAEITVDQDVIYVLPGETFEVTGTLTSEFGEVNDKTIELYVIVKDRFGDYQSYLIGDITTLEEGTFTLEGITTEIPEYGDLADGEYTLVVSLVDEQLVADPVELTLEVGNVPILTAEDVTDYTTDTQITITGTLFAPDGETPLTDAQVFLYDENDNQIAGPAIVQNDGSFTFEIDNEGTETLIVKYLGDDTYAAVSTDVTVTVSRVETTIENVDVPAGVPTEPTTITGTLVDDEGNVIGGEEINIFIDDVLVGTGKTDEFGNFAVTINPLDEGTYDLVIEYPGSLVYQSATRHTSITVAKLDATLTVTADDVLYTEETIISGTLMDGETPIADAEVYVTVGDEIVGTVTTDKFGYYEIAYTATTTGEYTVVAQYTGDDKYNAAEATDTFTVSTVETQITVPDVSGKVNETVDLTAIVTDTEGNPITTGDVIFKINGKTLKDEDGNTITVAVDGNGVATLPYVLDHTPKDYVLTASYIGDEIYERADSDNATITVKKVKADTITTVSDVIGTINSTVDLTATVVDEYGDPVTSGEVSFKLNGVTIKDEEGNTLTAPVVDGVATLPYVLDHSAKTYNITAVYAGDSDYASSRDESGVLTVEKGVLDTTITVSDVTGKQGETVDLVATIVDENGNAVLDGSVVFKLNGVTIKDEDGNAILVDVVDGVATLPYELVNSAKDYTISATYSGSEYYTSSRTEEDATLTVLDPLAAVVTPVDVSGKMGETVDLTATVTDVDGNAVNSGKVAFKLNGVTLKDENGDVIYADVEDGIATLPYEIVNSPKDYTITALYYSDDQSVIKNAKSEDDAVLTVEKEDITATLDDITITQGENANIAFTIYDENGDQVTKDTKVVVKANGKTQVSTTVENGEVNIELPSESFKNPTYDITVVIGENSYYNGLTLDATLYVE